MFKTLDLSMCMHVPDPFDEDFLKVLWGSEIVDGAFVFFEIERILKESGRTPWDLKNMIKLMFLNSMDKEESSREISKSAKSNNWYRMFCGEIEPSSRSIRDYRKIYNAIYQLILSFVLIVTHKLDLSDFYHVSVDGTIMLACNSPFNTICKKDVHLLLKHYMVEELSKKEIKKLRKRARKFLIKNKLSYDDTIELLYDWYDKLELTGQKSIPLWDVDAGWMKIKDKGQKYKKLTYNVQFCTDTKTKMICAINPVQYPTDHYQIPAIVDQAFRNLPIKPRMLSADTIYGTLSNFYYLKQHGISARIPTREQCKTLNEE